MSSSPIPSTDQLVTFLTIARLGGFTKAAQELDLTQPALSRQIQHLESRLGVQLFERLGRSVRLTIAGEQLVQRAGPLLEELGRLVAGLGISDGAGATGRVRLGTSDSVAIHVLPPILRSFMAAHPRVDLRLVCATTEQLPSMVVEGLIDLAIANLEFEPASLTMTPLWEEELVLVLPMGHRNRSRSILSYRDEGFILPAPGTIVRRLIDRQLARIDLRLKVVFEHANDEVVKSMVAAGLGLAILGEPCVRRETRRGELAAWPLVDLPLTRASVALRDPRRASWPAEEALLAALVAYGRKGSSSAGNPTSR